MKSVLKKIKEFSEAFTLLPTLIVMLTLSMIACSFLSLEKYQLNLVEKKSAHFEQQLSEKNSELEKEWFNVAD